MSHQRLQIELNAYLTRSSELLGEPGRPVFLDWPLDSHLNEDAVFERRRGIATDEPIRQFFSGALGHSTVDGLELFRVQVDDRTVRVVKVCAELGGLSDDAGRQLWVFPAGQFVRLYRYLRKRARESEFPNTPPPVMPHRQQERLLDNTVRFLRRRKGELAEYGVPQKRGLLLTGEPGNGKTTACRWLYSECRRFGLMWRQVTVDQYQNMRQHGHAANLFQLPKPGIVLFDDFDLGMRDREEVGATTDHSTLLAELDGLEQREGVVYLFTTNSRPEQLDPAFLRRGRIDDVVEFPRPTADLRRKLIESRWHQDLLEALDVERIVQQTDGLSFAELDELKKLVVIRHFEAGGWDWNWAWDAFNTSQRDRVHPRRRIGFVTETQWEPADEDLGVAGRG